MKQESFYSESAGVFSILTGCVYSTRRTQEGLKQRLEQSWRLDEEGSRLSRFLPLSVFVSRKPPPEERDVADSLSKFLTLPLDAAFIFSREGEKKITICRLRQMHAHIGLDTKEVIVDYRRSRRTEHAPLLIHGEAVERVNNIKFLGIHITSDLTWSMNTAHLVKKAQQRLFFLRKLKRAGLSPQLLTNFYRATIESILCLNMVNMGRGIVPACAQFVSPEQLRCTAYVSQGPDSEYDNEFSPEVEDSLHCSALFWSVSRSVISVTLSSAQQRVFLVENSHPHIALSKSPSEEWKDLGLFTLK
ncbi:hypothetical protein L3Q82_007914 [Scortum barcoo]|uniref:Uncharacterized protein n=1 Tax=Scortum barcoo TaxID=214431 RepID=A0ACB8WKS1_9TELE|nr:hypothetical protein L3Q82_007914 [Scortum barcoo]